MNGRADDQPREPPRRVAFALGDTAGHTYPALAIVEAYQMASLPIEPLFLGPGGGFAATRVPAAGFRFEPIGASALARVGWAGRALSLARLARAVAHARRLLREHGARLVLGFGGFVSGAVIPAARSLGLPTAIHEANVEPGLANRLLAPWVDRVFLGRATAGGRLRTRRLQVTGHPVRRAIAALASRERRPAPPERPARVLVISGTRGSRFLAAHAPALLERLAALRAVEVRHQACEADLAELRRAYARAGLPAQVCAELPEIAEDYAWADLAVARAGAGTLAELALAATPALLVPLADAAEDHQSCNARAFAETGAGLWVREADWRIEALVPPLAALLGSPEAWLAASRRARADATPDAAARIVRECEQALRGVR